MYSKQLYLKQLLVQLCFHGKYFSARLFIFTISTKKKEAALLKNTYFTNIPETLNNYLSKLHIFFKQVLE